jgi:ribosomal protein S18 acetylase RimI-like enzyme
MLNIREAKLEEIENIEALYKDLKSMENKKYGQACSIHWSFKKQDSKYFGKRLTQDSGIVLVSEEDDKLTGFICGFISDQVDKDKKRYAKVENIYVASSMRGKGVGSRLVDAFLKAAGEKGAQLVKVAPIMANETARDFYLHKGFEKYAVVLQKTIN